MGAKVLAGYLNAGGRRGRLAAATFYDSVTMTAFGPVMTVGDVATIEEIMNLGQEFLEFVETENGSDARFVMNDELHTLLVRFLREHEEKENEEMEGGVT